MKDTEVLKDNDSVNQFSDSQRTDKDSESFGASFAMQREEITLLDYGAEEHKTYASRVSDATSHVDWMYNKTPPKKKKEGRGIDLTSIGLQTQHSQKPKKESKNPKESQ